jgi:hypothetical protein
MISKKALDEFKQIYEEEYKEKLDDDAALKKSIAMLTVFKTVYKPMLKTN